MNVLHVVADGRPGGGTTNVLALVEDLREAGVNRLGLVTERDSYALRRAREFADAAYGLDFFRSRLSRGLPRELKEIIASVGPDLVHVHGARAGFFFALSRCDDVPSAYTVRGYHFLRKPIPAKWLAASAERLASSAASATVHVCEYDRQLAHHWKLVPSRKERRVIYNGIRPMEIPQAAAVDPRLVVFVGRLTYQKDPFMIVDVAKRLAGLGYRFKVVGGGELEKAIRNAVRGAGLLDVVEITGELPREDALEAMRSGSVFMLPSRWEGLPIAPVEAMQMGLPVVISDVSGNPEVVGFGEAGILVTERSADAYARAVRLAAEDGSLREALVRNGRERVAKYFDRAVVTEQYLDLYRTLIERRRTRV